MIRRPRGTTESIRILNLLLCNFAMRQRAKVACVKRAAISAVGVASQVSPNLNQHASCAHCNSQNSSLQMKDGPNPMAVLAICGAAIQQELGCAAVFGGWCCQIICCAVAECGSIKPVAGVWVLVAVSRASEVTAGLCHEPSGQALLPAGQSCSLPFLRPSNMI
jgi:hypothetical protein